MSYEELLTETALADERFIVMTAENRALVRNLPALLGRRFIDTGITEQTMVGAAAGLALRGRTPIVHALTAFLTMRAFEFVRTDVGIANLPVKLSGFIPGLLSDANGPTHQAIEDVALMRGIPNMTVFAPADEDDLVKMLPFIWQSDEPAYTRINTRKTTYQHGDYIPGKAEVISTGTDVTILTYGLLFEQALVAVEILKDEGLSVGLTNMRNLKPVDEQAILDATTSNLVVTLEDHFLTGGLYTIVAETLLKHQQNAAVLPFALNDSWFRPALLPDVLQNEGFTGKQIAERILSYQTNHIQSDILKSQFAE
ncbi:transketolase family protein [Mucilaginibacter sp. UR6-11]|uniref:transketolase family protein n=1 Tax=Mucilaginibacter sp. UR6-11 TaxID=1435644 RepID=UPI001E2FB850|nr:transketolase C-terminal domain-containing protein [Mucilaginibacter sp. UR6-11]MCC8423535.1 transketolase [Mucilaginibacter sp. UR6-11]